MEKLSRLYRFPANYKEAQVHAHASKFGKSHQKLKDGTLVPVCPCCENLTSTKLIPLCYHTTPSPPQPGEEIFMIATDVSLYFLFVKMCIFYLLLKMLVFDAYTAFMSSQGQYCANLHAANPTQTCAYTVSGYNLNSSVDQMTLNIVDILGLAFTVFSIIYFIFFRRELFRIRDWLDFNEVSQDDFTLLVEDIPAFIFDEDTTKDSLEFEYKAELEERFEEKIFEWLEKMVHYKD
jgi:hypothetical protein